MLAGSSKKKSAAATGGFSLKFSNQKVNIYIHFMLIEVKWRKYVNCGLISLRNENKNI
jgi:hypothetical protein